MEQKSTAKNQAPAAPQQHIDGPAGEHFGRGPNRKKFMVIAAVVAILLVGGSVAALFATKGDKNQAAPKTTAITSSNAPVKTGSDSAFAQQTMQGCKDRQVSFTAWPVPFDQTSYFVPMGQVSDGHVTPTDHVYLIGKDSHTMEQNAYDIVMPADGTMTMVAAMPAQYIGDKNQQTAPEDYRIQVVHNCQYSSIFIHVHQLSAAVKAAVGTLKPNESKQIQLEMKAGDKIGRIGSSVDWTLVDVNQKLSGYITPGLYQSESWKIHTIDPVSVYKGDLKTKVIALSLRSTEPYGGKIDYDQKGKLIGNWFKEGTNGYQGAGQDRYWDGHLSVAPNNIDPTATVLSIGNWNGKAAQFTIRGTVDTSGVSAQSGIVKYEVVKMNYMTTAGQPSFGTYSKGMKLAVDGAVEGTVLFEVMDGERLKAEAFPGKTAEQVAGFTDKAAVYVR